MPSRPHLPAASGPPAATRPGADTSAATFLRHVFLLLGIVTIAPHHIVAQGQEALSVTLNRPTFNVGQTIQLTATLRPISPPRSLDAYIVLRLPDGLVFSLQLGGALVPGVAPIARGVVPFSFTGAVLQYTVSGVEPAGLYTLLYALTEPGTLNVVGALGQTSFALHYPETLVDRLTAEPAVLQDQVSTSVTFRAHLPGYDARSVESVELQEHDDRGNVTASYGFMRDDGNDGDAAAHDGIFSLQTSLVKSGPQYLSIRASVHFEGEQGSNLSQPLVLPVAITESVDEVRTSLATALDATQRATAYQRLGQRFNDAAVLDALSPSVLRALAAAMGRCTLTDSSDFHSVCTGVEDLPTGSTQRHFLFIRDAVGVWRLIAW